MLYGVSSLYDVFAFGNRTPVFEFLGTCPKLRLKRKGKVSKRPSGTISHDHKKESAFNSRPRPCGSKIFFDFQSKFAERYKKCKNLDISYRSIK